MDAELEKLVKLASCRQKQLKKLDTSSRTFCLHKSWGFGRVAEWISFHQIVIDFTGKKGHPMQLHTPPKNLIVIPAEHFLARQGRRSAATKTGQRRSVAPGSKHFESLMEKATRKRSEEWMVPDLFNEANGKRWWESGPQTLKKARIFHSREKDRADPNSRRRHLARRRVIEGFHQARQPKEQVAALEQS